MNCVSLSFFFSLGDLLEQHANDQRFTSQHPIVLLYEAILFRTDIQHQGPNRHDFASIFSPLFDLDFHS